MCDENDKTTLLYDTSESSSLITHGGIFFMKLVRFRSLLAQIFWLIMRVGSLVIGRRRLKFSVEGTEHIPRSGPVLIATRHFHYFYDGYILVRTVPRRLHIIVALDWLQIQLLRLLIELGCFLADWPVILRPEQLQEHAENGHWAYQRREGRRYLRQVMQSAMRLLRSGEVLVVFPEGYPNIDVNPTLKLDLTTLLPFRPGFIKMVEWTERDGWTRVAIVPAGLTYTRERDTHWQATVRFGPALYLDNFVSAEEARHAVEEQVRVLSHAVSLSHAGELPENPLLS
jgi:putative membrane protein